MSSLDIFQSGHPGRQRKTPSVRLHRWCGRAIRGICLSSAATLGLSADEFHELLHEDVQYLSPRLPPELLGTWLPEQFMPLVSLLWSYRATDDPLARWLSHAIAAACYGRQHLWQDLGFNSRDDVSRLIGQWFPRLFNLNTQNLKWKRFLFEQLGRKQGKPGLRPPFCHGCDSYRLCFSGN